MGIPDDRRSGAVASLLFPGIAVPFIYYGIQAAAAPSFPDFSFVATTASELGSDRSPYGWLFNWGIMVQGVATLVAAVGFWLAFRRLGVHWALAVPTVGALAMNGVQTLWAGFFPMPDPRHGGHGLFQAAMLALPVLLTASLWRVVQSRGMRVYFVGTIVLLLAMIPFMTGRVGFDTGPYRGLIQRVFTLAIFPPIGVAAFVLLRQIWTTVVRLPA